VDGGLKCAAIAKPQVTGGTFAIDAEKVDKNTDFSCRFQSAKRLPDWSHLEVVLASRKRRN
jgi:hypothetical protein